MNQCANGNDAKEKCQRTADSAIYRRFKFKTVFHRDSQQEGFAVRFHDSLVPYTRVDAERLSR